MYINKVKIFLMALLFLPSITFSIVNAEIFPWPLVFLLLYKLKINKEVLILIFLILFSIIYGVFVTKIYSIEIIRSSFAYLNVLLITIFLMKCELSIVLKISKVLTVIFGCLIVIGILQTINALDFADSFFKLLVRRGSVAVTEGQRGVRLLSSEPSRAAIELIFMYAAIRISVIPKKNKLLFDILFSIFILIIIKSATGLLFLLLLMLLYNKLILIPLLLIFLLIISSANFDFMISSDSRAIKILGEVLENLSLKNIYDLSIKYSGFRFPSVLSSYIYSLENIFGGGLGQWQISSINALNMLPTKANEIVYFQTMFNSQFVSVRPTSFAASVALDFGLLGLLFLTVFILKIVRAIRLDKKILPIFLIFLFYIYFLGEIGNPVPWIAFIISMRIIKERTNNENFIHSK